MDKDVFVCNRLFYFLLGCFRISDCCSSKRRNVEFVKAVWMKLLRNVNPRFNRFFVFLNVFCWDCSWFQPIKMPNLLKHSLWNDVPLCPCSPTFPTCFWEHQNVSHLFTCFYIHPRWSVHDEKKWASACVEFAPTAISWVHNFIKIRYEFKQMHLPGVYDVKCFQMFYFANFFHHKYSFWTRICLLFMASVFSSGFKNWGWWTF